MFGEVHPRVYWHFFLINPLLLEIQSTFIIYLELEDLERYQGLHYIFGEGDCKPMIHFPLLFPLLTNDYNDLLYILPAFIGSRKP